MLSFNDIKTNAIRSFMAKKMLSEGYYPSLEYITAKIIDKYQFSDLYKSLLGNKHFLMEKEIASSDKLNTIQECIDIDLTTMYEFIDHLNKNFNDTFAEINQKIAAANKELDRLHEIIDRKLVEASSTEGFLHVKDIELFKNVVNEYTSTSVDHTNKTIMAGKSNLSKQVDIINLLDSVGFSPVTLGTTGTIQSEIYSLGNLYDSMLDTKWSASIFTPSTYSGYVEGALVFIFNSLTEINTINLNFADELYGIQYSISVKADVNGETVLISPYEKYTDFAIIEFDSIVTQKVLIYLTTNKSSVAKALPNSIEYKFSLREVSFLQSGYNEKSYHVTSCREELNTKSSYTLISDDIVPSDCSVKYYVTAGGTQYHVVPLNYGNSINNFFNTSDSKYSIATASPIKLDVTDPNLYENNVLFNTTAPSYDMILRGVGTILADEKYYICTLFNGSLNSIIDFKNIPGLLNGKSVNSTIVLDEYFYEFKFIKSISNLTTYFSALNAWKAKDVKNSYGTVIANPIDLDKFLNIIEEDNIKYYNNKYVKKSINNINSARNYSWEDELISPIVVSEVSAATLSKVTIEITSNGNKTPIIKSLKLKGSL